MFLGFLVEAICWLIHNARGGIDPKQELLIIKFTSFVAQLRVFEVIFSNVCDTNDSL